MRYNTSHKVGQKQAITNLFAKVELARGNIDISQHRACVTALVLSLCKHGKH